MWEYLFETYRSFSLKDAVDIVIVALGIYWLLLLIRGTRAIQMLVGLFLLILTLAASKYFQLFTVQWVLDKFLGSFVLLIIVIFQHDIRRGLTKVGRGLFFPHMGRWQETQVLEEITKAATSCASKRIGALIVLERETGLENYVEIGQSIDAEASKDLLVSIFMPGSPLHDGAVIVQRGRIVAAGCFLPLTLSPGLHHEVGTRHRAALGLTEETDAVVVVVSEQTGKVSVVEAGVIRPASDAAALRAHLKEAMGRETGKGTKAEGVPAGKELHSP
jgi:diadenylate cyclase